jgi:hypothetical protein
LNGTHKLPVCVAAVDLLSGNVNTVKKNTSGIRCHHNIVQNVNINLANKTLWQVHMFGNDSDRSGLYSQRNEEQVKYGTIQLRIFCLPISCQKCEDLYIQYFNFTCFI